MQPFDPQILSCRSGINISKNSCEAYGCNNKATSQVTVTVGRLGDIDLNLCKSCIPEFDENDKKVKSDWNQTAPEEEELAKLNGKYISTT
jgi:hypothetical protein